MNLADFLQRPNNRRARRQFKNKAQLENKSKKTYTTKRTHRRKNGKKIQRVKK